MQLLSWRQHSKVTHKQDGSKNHAYQLSRDQSESDRPGITLPTTVVLQAISAAIFRADYRSGI